MDIVGFETAKRLKEAGFPAGRKSAGIRGKPPMGHSTCPARILRGTKFAIKHHMAKRHAQPGMVHSEALKIIITANGNGERMKGLSPRPKHLLYYGGKRIIDHIIEAMQPFGEVRVFGRHSDRLPTGVWMECGETESRKAQLEIIREWENVLIVDCDVIPVWPYSDMWRDFDESKSAPDDAIWYFESDCPKYGGLEADENWRLVAAKERGQGHKYRASGLYFLKHVGATIDRMADPNSIASGMAGAFMIFENTFIRVGDAEDYLNALK